jgi:hypothetical protein
MRKNWQSRQDDAFTNGKVTYCPIGGKVQYDKKGATTAANKRYSEAHQKLRIYQCPECNFWHLTKILNDKPYRT